MRRPGPSAGQHTHVGRGGEQLGWVFLREEPRELDAPRDIAASPPRGDPPIAKLDLISCRNVRIHFDTELQHWKPLGSTPGPR